jgi:signal transduction histidine kinase
VDLGEVLALAVADVRARHPDVQLTVDAPDEPVVVDGWEPGLRMVAGNLIGNAARHGGGRVQVTLRGGEAPVLLVDDDGAGIPPAERERIFEPFRRLEEAADRPGTGLGLALVAQQVRSHGATVSVEDSPLGGARLSVALRRPS